jgi:hypothetical protein
LTTGGGHDKKESSAMLSGNRRFCHACRETRGNICKFFNQLNIKGSGKFLEKMRKNAKKFP